MSSSGLPVGSSPRVRGKLLGPGVEDAEIGLIPACAGKTRRGRGPWWCRWAHPRVCGENVIAEEAQVDAAGSSPRVRGKLPAHELNAAGQRLIPACAGKTAFTTSRWSSSRAHPRVCGENSRLARDIDIPLGSSPRVRGKRRTRSAWSASMRLIPACAGKTGRTVTTRARPPAHPRVCGENVSRWTSASEASGSSPRVRGKQLLDGLGGVGGGLIPACAGKTTSTPGSTQSWTAHPRVCGENGAGADPDGVLDGSSPRVRGKHPHGHQQIAAGRLIPACAGKTLGVPPWDLGHMAHPRVCGENMCIAPVPWESTGSSPRVRGKPAPAKTPDRRRRLIPACAGKTPRW